MYISLFFLIFFYKKEFLILIFQLNINYNLFKIIHKKNEKDYIHFACLIFSTNIYIYILVLRIKSNFLKIPGFEIKNNRTLSCYIVSKWKKNCRAKTYR